VKEADKEVGDSKQHGVASESARHRQGDAEHRPHRGEHRQPDAALVEESQSLGGETADRDVRFVFSNGQPRSWRCSATASARRRRPQPNPNLRWLIELCLAGMRSVCSMKSGMSSCGARGHQGIPVRLATLD
jgi:hypothetical protein